MSVTLLLYMVSAMTTNMMLILTTYEIFCFEWQRKLFYIKSLNFSHVTVILTDESSLDELKQINAKFSIPL